MTKKIFERKPFNGFLGLAAVALSFGLILAGCDTLAGTGVVGESADGITGFDGGGTAQAAGESPVFSTVGALAEYLRTATEGTKAVSPLTVRLALNISQQWVAVNTVTLDRKKYVVLDLSGCTATSNKIAGNETPAGNDMNILKTNPYIRGFVLPSTLRTIGDYAFCNCSAFETITIPNSVTSIGDYAFYGCTGLTSVAIPDSVTSIGDRAFYGCTGLTNVTIGAGVTSISNSAFSGCTNLTGVTIGKRVTSIGESAFYGCTSLSVITVNAGNTAYSSDAGVLFNKTKTTLIQYPAQKTGASYTIPSSVTGIGGYAFYGCTGLISVTIPDSVTSIGESAFYGCAKLTFIIIPDAVTSIGSSAFSGCTGLTSALILSSTITTIESNTFSGCSSLESIVIPSSVSSIWGGAFLGCSALTSVTFAGNNTGVYYYYYSSYSYSYDAFPYYLSLMSAGGSNLISGAYGSRYHCYKMAAGTYTRKSGGTTWTKQ